MLQAGAVPCPNKMVLLLPASVADIVDTAVVVGSFNTLAAVLTKADLVGALKDGGLSIVFTSTDDAFAA